MSVLHDYKCDKHGYFEDYQANCPRCGKESRRVYLKPPGIKSARTKGADSTLRQLASDYHMTDIRSAREGESQAGTFKHANVKEGRPGDAAIWGGGFKGISLDSVVKGQVAKSIHGESVGVRPQDTGNLTGPKAASYLADHENLKIKK